MTHIDSRYDDTCRSGSGEWLLSLIRDGEFPPGRAKKKSSPQLEEDGQLFEYHWYEHPGIGRVELKKKWVEERS